MSRRTINLIVIVILLAVAIIVDLPSTTKFLGTEPKTVLGLDLRGGMQVILQVDPNYTGEVTPEELETAKSILESRSNALGVSETTFQTSGERYIVGDLPGVTDTEDVVDIIKQTGQLEFVDTGSEYLDPGTEVKTDLDSAAQVTDPLVTTLPGTETQAQPVYHTVMTGDQLDQIAVTRDGQGVVSDIVISFTLKPEGAATFATHTTANVNNFLAIVLDKKVLSCPRINSPITEGEGIITGDFTVESANALAVQLRYGSLPIPLVVEQVRVIGPTLGQDSLNKSLVAFLIGFIIVTLFMLIYYRLPGFAAILAILSYGAITFAIFRLIPVTLTLPGIAGILLSTGSALDANILLFERMKEELRAGRTVQDALDLGWKRAWSSIRDSNIAALLTSGILYWFGNTFGASIVKGFSITLALGVFVSVFAAFFITRTVLRLLVKLIRDPEKHLGWFGI
ncbi:MAG TPA: protein translocase subunit SecD [Anaerolineaceae bacterium]|nr:protein translocase subunit SecD [Anaerolineaceae bacterium]